MAKTTRTYRWTCAHCGTACERPAVRGQRPRWCSQRCSDLGKKGRAGVCQRCGVEYFGLGAKYCSIRCTGSVRGGRSTELVHVGPAPEPVAPPTPTTVVTLPKWWGVIVNGPCAWCGEAFTALSGAAKYCSQACSRKAGLARRGDFMPEPRFRYAIYRRDAWTCQLCFEPVERDLRGDDYNPWSPSLDHIIPRSHGGADSWENLRLAHAWCNSVRGAGDYHPDLFEEASNVPLGVRA